MGISSTSNISLPPATDIPAVSATEYDAGAAAVVNEMGGAKATRTSASITDLVNISGASGVFQFAGIYADAVGLSTSQLKITIDGSVVYDETQAITAEHLVSPIGYMRIIVVGNTGSSVIYDKYSFRNSFKVEFASDGTNVATGLYKYYLT